MRPKRIINLIGVIFCASLFLRNGSLLFAAQENAKKNPEIEANAAVDKTSIQIGDKVTYTITVKAKKDIEVEFPKGLPENLSGFSIKDFGSSQRGLLGKNVFKQWYLLDTYVSGEHIIPAAEVKYRVKEQSDWRQLNVNEVKLEVKSLLDNASERADIRDIRGPRNFAEKIWLYVLGLLVFVLILGGVFGFIFLKKKKFESETPYTPAHIIAYAALAELEKKDYLRHGQTKAYYTELSDIVRHYLEDRFNIRAPEMTTEEFLIKVREDGSLSVEHKSLLRDFLTNCDLVKFAKYQPAQTEASLAFASAKKLIDQTKQEDLGCK
ncbi:MAG: BatD family protein [Candidatus Omnitrophica bacterium]|nr:BatD family protein [Candidatus Omnitrophota bacterium]